MRYESEMLIIAYNLTFIIYVLQQLNLTWPVNGRNEASGQEGQKKTI